MDWNDSEQDDSEQDDEDNVGEPAKYVSTVAIKALAATIRKDDQRKHGAKFYECNAFFFSGAVDSVLTSFPAAAATQ